MSSKIAEMNVEEAIECALLLGGPDVCEGIGEVAAESSPGSRSVCEFVRTRFRAPPALTRLS
jgi:hypothetical protein